MKANYPVPEIWLAGEEDQRMQEAADTLGQSGLVVALVNGDALCEIPARSNVTSFAFGEGRLSMQLEGGELELPYDAPVTAVYCTPRGQVEEARRSGGGGLTEGLRQRSSSIFMTRDSLVGFGGLGGRSSQAGFGGEEGAVEAAFMDLYTGGADPRRLGFVLGAVDFAGLGELALENPIANLEMFVQEFDEKFEQGTVDRRLIDLQPRQRPMVGEAQASAPERKGYSYATQALARLLESISPDLKAMSQFELSSRLAYITAQQGFTSQARRPWAALFFVEAGRRMCPTGPAEQVPGAHACWSR